MNGAAWQRVLEAAAAAEPLMMNDDGWLILADALEEVHERRLARNLRTLVRAFRRLVTYESANRARPRSWTTDRAAARAYARFYALQMSVLTRISDLVHARTFPNTEAIAQRMARRLNARQRSTLAWIIEDWEWPYRGSPINDVIDLVKLGLLDPPTDTEWGDATAFAHAVWRYARPQWINEQSLGEAQLAVKRPGPLPARPAKR